jgi:hypothetical protein
MWNAGNNYEGQIGDGTTTASSTGKTLTEVTYFSSKGITINKVYGGGYFTFADTSDGYYCWGNGGNGVFGNGSTGNITSGPAKWTNVTNIKKFMASTQHTTAITEDGKYYAWGRGYHLSRGDNDTGDISYPKHIDTLPNILAPSFDYDGYDKVFVNKPYEIQIWCVLAQVKSGSSLDGLEFTGITPSKIYIPYQNDWYTISSSGMNVQWNANGTEDGYPLNINEHVATIYVNENISNLTGLEVKYSSSQTQNRVLGLKFIINGVTISEETTKQTADSNYKTSYSFTPSTFSPITKYTKGTTTYDVGTASIITVPDPGTYDAQLSQGGVFSLKSATVPATKASGLYTWAFHHGNFDNAYGDGDILTARDNGRFYADTPAYTGDIGTITPAGTPSSFVYEFYISVKLDGGSLNEWHSYGITTTSGTLTQSMLQIHPTISSGALSDMFNGSYTSGTLLRIADGNHEVGTKIMTLTSPFELADITFYVYRPYYQPGYKIVLNGNIILNETTNAGSAQSPNPASFTKTLPVNANTTYTFASASALTANVLMVAGGAGGGGNMGGGGGAGGLVYTTGTSLAQGVTKTIIVGNGSSGGVQTGIILNGNDTSFTGLTTSVGGGSGGGGQYGGAGSSIGYAGGDGGSGGGGTSGSNPKGGGSGTLNQGNSGGSGDGGGRGGGGGGAGGAGETGNTSGNDGGTGLNYSSTFGTFYGDSGWFASGGGGGGNADGDASKGGGGGGHGGNAGLGSSAIKHTGGGGGGGGKDNNSGNIGGRGGSGIVLLQTNVATPNVNSEVKIPEPHYHVLIEKPDDTHFSHLPSLGNSNPHFSGSIVPNIPRADGSVSNVYYATSSEYFYAASAGSLVSTVEGIFYPIEQQRYDNILEIGHNSTHDVELEMAADGTAKLYRSNGGTQLASSTVKCFTVGKWHHIALTLDANRNAVGYVNGYPVVSATYASAILPGSRTQMCLYRTGVTATFRKFLMYYFKTYNSVLNQNQILKLASSVGLGPKLEYDGLNTIKILNTEPGSSVKLFTSNVADTSNVFIVADPAAGEYTVPEAGKYYAEIKGTDTFTITKTLDVSGTFPLYAYPPRDGTQGSITSSITADVWNTWTISGAANGNGQYQARSNRTATGTRNVYKAFSNNVGTSGTGEFQVTHGGSTHYTGTIDLQLPSAKTIRKYVIWTTDSAFYKHNSTTYTDYDPTLPYNASERNYRRIKSWSIQGSNDDSSWTTIHTVTNKPPSIYGDVHTISSPASYQYYRLSWSDNNGSTETTCIAELIYYGD